MLAAIWEHTSVYYIISIIFAIICLIFTYLWSSHDEKSDVAADESIAPVAESTVLDSNADDLLMIRKPLRLAKKLEDKLPEEAKMKEKK